MAQDAWLKDVRFQGAHAAQQQAHCCYICKAMRARAVFGSSAHLALSSVSTGLAGSGSEQGRELSVALVESTGKALSPGAAFPSGWLLRRRAGESGRSAFEVILTMVLAAGAEIRWRNDPFRPRLLGRQF